MNDDVISRQAAIDAIYETFCYAYCDNCEKEMNEDLCGDCHRKYQNWAASKKIISKTINSLPFAQRYTDEEIQAMQDLEQAQLDKAYQIGVEEGLRSAQPQWIPCSEKLPEEYGEYRITWTTSASKNRLIGDAEYEVTGEWDEVNGRFKGEWLLDEYIKNYPNVEVLAWKPLEEPWKGEER